MHGTTSGYAYGIRPVVVLSPDVTFEDTDGDGVYEIIYEGEDTTPPTAPEIKVVSGTKSESGEYYTSTVKVKIIPGEDSGSGVKNTTYFNWNNKETDISTLNDNCISLTTEGTREIVARTYDNAGNYSESTLTLILKDETPPSDPSLFAVKGLMNSSGIYKTGVHLDILRGSDDLSDLEKTEYSIDGGTTWETYGGDDIVIFKEGSFSILARTYNTKGYVSNTVKLVDLTIDIDETTSQIGRYVEYDVSYKDMYSLDSYDKNNGWRYLGTDSSGNKLLISSGIPMILRYGGTDSANNYKKWWDFSSTGDDRQFTNGILKNIDKIPYAKVSEGTKYTEDESTINTMFGLFDGTQTTTESGETYTAVGTPFSLEEYKDKILGIRTTTIEDLEKVMYEVTGIDYDTYSENLDKNYEINLSSTYQYTWYWSAGTLLMGRSYGLFHWDYINLPVGDYDDRDSFVLIPDSYPNQYSPFHNTYLYIYGAVKARPATGIRPVIVLDSSVEFEDANGDGVYEIK